jgi:hypothetical protein
LLVCPALAGASTGKRGLAGQDDACIQADGICTSERLEKTPGTYAICGRFLCINLEKRVAKENLARKRYRQSGEIVDLPVFLTGSLLPWSDRKAILRSFIKSRKVSTRTLWETVVRIGRGAACGMIEVASQPELCG